MNMRLALFLLGLTFVVRADPLEVSMPLTPDLQRADLYVLKVTKDPVGLLVLCPGCNSNGEAWIENVDWQDFARESNLDLVGLSFASDVSLLQQGRGYYYARQGSGELLLRGLNRVYHKSLPLVLYGFSGGAHFTSGFVEWAPRRVVAWCAYSAGWWDRPQVAQCPPGLVACGEDDQRLGASLIYFKLGRALGNPWLWLCAPKNAHSIYLPAENFVRNYFTSILKDKGSMTPGEWVDLDSQQKAAQVLVKEEPSVTGWLPDSRLLSKWQEVDSP